MALLLAPAQVHAEDPAAPGDGAPAVEEEEVPLFQGELVLRPYLVTPKFRFRKGSDLGDGSSIRTQKVGLDETAFALGGAAALWIDGADRLQADAWMMAAGGEGVVDRRVMFDGVSLAAGTPVSIDYAMTFISVEYAHRFTPVDWCWFDLGLRVDYLDLRLNVLGLRRLRLESAYPVPSLRIGFRPSSWLELEGRASGFELTTVSFGTAEGEKPYEIMAMARLHLGRGAFLEAGGMMYHVHLERDAGRVTEDVLHLRHRAVFFSLGVSF